MAVAIISHDHIGLSMVWEFFSCRLIVCLSVGEHANVGVHDSLFVAANVDDFNCLHMALVPLQR